MLYLKEKISESFLLGIWKIEESKEELLSSLERKDFLEKDILSVSSASKQLERLAVRVLFKTLLSKEVNIQYNKAGKPYLDDNSFYISISHTKDYVAVILDKQNEVAIDIEKISDKVKRVRPKFVSDNEYIDSDNELIHLLLHWSAKETMYKILGIQGIDLKADLHISKFIPEEKGIIFAYETHTLQKRNFEIKYWVTDEFVLTRI